MLRGSTGLGLFAAGLSAGLWRPASVLAGGSVPPNPIPGGSPAGGGELFHAYGPGPGNLNADPSTIFDFKGAIGLAYLDGMVTRTNTATGEARQLPTIGSDMRFMTGAYRGADGAEHQGAFAYI